ncbi:MAG: glycosyltransferase family 39 protein [Alphaproteobacteria bacterium]|nr:glycosyltransferase family 39 protein [Alphaproteobacteria bacterium]
MSRAVLPLAALAGFTLMRLALAAHLGLVADEAYYWCWSKALAWGYFDHPPAIAGLIAAGTLPLGDTELGVRAPGLMLQGVVLAGLVAHGRWSPLLTALLMTTPLLALGGVLATPDVPLVCAWGLALIAAERGRWGWVGVACGAAMLSKYTGVLLWPALWLAADKRRPGVYGAGLIAAALVAPNVAWNASNDWISYRFQLSHGFPEAGAPGLAGLAAFWGGQAGVAGPVVALAGLWWLARGPRGNPVLWWSALLPLGLFSLAATRGPAEANWAAPAWISVLVGLSRAEGALRRLSWLGASLGAVLSLGVAVHAVRPLVPLPQDASDELYAGAWLGPPVEAWGLAPVLCERYQEAAWIRFYGGVDATTAPDVGRMDQFDLWPRTLPAETVYVRPALSHARVPIADLYPETGGSNVVLARRGERVIATWQVIPVRGYAGGAHD